MADSSVPTLYINNINEKVKIDVLKKMFYMVFSQYGKVVDISARKGSKLRGQAWVTFQDVSAATNALRGKQGFNFYGKALRISYAKPRDLSQSSAANGSRAQKRKRDGDEDSADEGN